MVYNKILFVHKALKFICTELLLQKNWDLPPKPRTDGVAQPPQVDPLQEDLVPAAALPEAGNKLPSAYQAAGFFFLFKTHDHCFKEGIKLMDCG